MPYFISPLSSQLTVEHKLSWFFFLHTIWSFCLICPFLSVVMCLPLPPSLSRYLSLFSLTSPFRCICHGNVKNLSCSNSFRALSVEKEGQFCFSLTTFCVLWFKGNEDHISSAWSYMTGRGWAGLLWENKYYGRSNFVIFISLGSMCVLLDRIHYTNTWARMQCAHIQSQDVYTVCKHAHT